jgi:hypothetical protein
MPRGASATLRADADPPERVSWSGGSASTIRTGSITVV